MVFGGSLVVFGGSWWFLVVLCGSHLVLGGSERFLWFLVALGSSMGFLVVLVVLGGTW